MLGASRPEIPAGTMSSLAHPLCKASVQCEVFVQVSLICGSKRKPSVKDKQTQACVYKKLLRCARQSIHSNLPERRSHEAQPDLPREKLIVSGVVC